MTQPLPRALAALIAAITIVSLILQFIVIREEFDYTVPHSMWVMARFLTILTNALAAGTFAILALNLRPVTARWLAGLTLWMLLVAGGYHLLLRATADVAGLEIWSDLGFHTVAPALTLIYWLICVPKGRLTLSDIPFFLSWPVIYVSYALTRGGLDGTFPYPFLDPSAIGWEPVLWTIGRFALGLLVFGSLMVLLDRLLDRFTSH